MKRNYRNKNAQKERLYAKLSKFWDKPCAKKVAYCREFEAKQAAEKESFKARKQLYYYKCKFCKEFHLTSQPPRNPK